MKHVVNLIAINYFYPKIFKFPTENKWHDYAQYV